MITQLVGSDHAAYRSADWPAEDRVYRADAAWFDGFAALDVFRDPEAWLDLAPLLQSFRTSDGPLSRSEARRRYFAGDSIYITGLQQTVKPLRDMCDELARALAVDKKSVSIEAWAAGAPTVVGMHFDLDFNFNVQVHGKKRWRTARNDHVQNPLTSYHVENPETSSLSSERGPTLTRTRSFPKSMPDDARSFEVSPGDVIYLPRGTWHCTETTEPTFAAAFVVAPPTWADHVGRVLVNRLSLEPQWRARVLGARDVEITTLLRHRAASALSAAAAHLADMTPSDLLFAASWGRVSDVFTRATDVCNVHIEASELRWSRHGTEGAVHVPPWALPAAEAIVAASRPWSFASLAEIVGSEDAAFLGVLILRLEAAGFLCRSDA